jgi:hypothetical protein
MSIRFFFVFVPSICLYNIVQLAITSKSSTSLEKKIAVFQQTYSQKMWKLKIAEIKIWLKYRTYRFGWLNLAQRRKMQKNP